MSRAFTKEIDDAPPAPLPERPVSRASNFVTARGAALIERELALLDAAIRQADDPARIDELARDQRYWAARYATMQVVAKPQTPVAVGFAVTVTIRRRGKEQTLAIVGEDEADPAAGLIAWTAPLARALEGSEAGESVAFEAGGRVETIEVIEIG